MEPQTKVRWVDEKRIYVETPQGDDYIVGFHDQSLYQCQRQAPWFQVDKIVATLFDKYYHGDASVIMGEINRQMMINHVGSIFSYYAFDKESISKERVRIGQRIRELRESKGMDAKHLAFFADIDAANLCRIEAGKYSVGLDILSKIGYALDMEIDFVKPKKKL
ncbi:helix-turn-helix domain-containing protein [Segatella baroniae]|jgi:DNA-binding XRE family transcriptional regulator|uniref:helix-turn-helix domain-containing protein n=1 Tax=Segatella baroniae TaxID=305719 RepID=UPI00040210C1|nr:helix-turn-helix transcriptional regulator [Segatella baroniae]